MRQIEFWFDFSCPYAYFASKSVVALAKQHKLEVMWKPMLLGGLFREIGAGAGPLPTLSAPKAAHLARDLTRWASVLNLPFMMPAGHPQRTVLALRTLLGLPQEQWPRAIAALFDLYWKFGRDIAQREQIHAALLEAGIAAADIAGALERANSDEVKQTLHARTSQAAALGIFGAPAVVLPGQQPLLFWGQDRLHWVHAALLGWLPDAEAAQPQMKGLAPGVAVETTRSASSSTTVDLFFDVASPYAFLALCQLRELAEKTGAMPKLRPILLGALFRDIGQVDVPLLGFSPNKQRYVGAELKRWGNWLDVPFSFPGKFPQRTIAAQRLILAAREQHPDAALALAIRIGKAMWCDQKSIEEEDVLRHTLSDCALPLELFAATQAAEIKQLLISETASAKAAGVFGVPTFIVDNGTSKRLYWGQDRLGFVAQALHDPALP